MYFREYKKAESLEEAWQLNQKKSARILGGTLWMRMSKNTFGTAIDLSGLGLDQIEETEEEFRIGCMTTLRQLECHEGLNVYSSNAVHDAVCHIVGVQFRNSATVGGSLWGRYGFSDVMTVFLPMDSYVELYKGGVIPLREFVKMEPDQDILVRLIIRKCPIRCSYQSVRRTKTDFPVLTLCAVRDEAGNYVISAGARPGRAMLLSDDRHLLKRTEDGTMEEGAVEAFARYAAQKIPTEGNLRGSGEYRSHLVRVLTERIIRNVEVESCRFSWN